MTGLQNCVSWLHQFRIAPFSKKTTHSAKIKFIPGLEQVLRQEPGLERVLQTAWSTRSKLDPKDVAEEVTIKNLHCL